MKINRTILTLLAIASGLLATQAQTFTTNNGVIVGSPGEAIPPMSARTNMLPWNRTNSGWNGRSNAPWNTRTNMPWNGHTNSFQTNRHPQHVPISSNLPSTSIQPPDSSLPPMTNAPGQRFQTMPGTVPGQNPNNPNMNNGQPRQPNQPANPTAPSTPPVRK